EDANKANEAATSAKKGLDWEKFKARQLAAFIGVISPEDLQDLSKLRADYEKGEFKDPDRPAFEGGLKKLSDPEAGPGWDAGLKKPLNPLLGQVAALTAELKNQRALYEKAERENKANLDEMNQRLAGSDARNGALGASLSATAKQAADVREKL